MYICLVKNLQLQIVFFVLVIITPIGLSTIDFISDFGSNYELCENPFEEEQNEERESEEEKETESLEGFSFFFQYSFTDHNHKKLNHTSRNNLFTYRHGDVLTPPPERL